MLNLRRAKLFRQRTLESNFWGILKLKEQAYTQLITTPVKDRVTEPNDKRNSEI